MLQLSLHNCLSSEVDVLSSQLEELGALAITWLDEKDSPIYEPGVGELPLWPWVTIQAIFDENINPDFLQRKVQEVFHEKSVEITVLPDQDWVANNQASFQPFTFGNNCWICPSWTPPVDPNGLNIILDPGLAFGTGHHATTFQCLSWLAQESLKGKTLIDYGCGSGVLAITALLLGAIKVQAVDIDPQAHIATLDNAKRNNILENQLSCHFPEDVLEPADIIIANILLRPLMMLVERFDALLKPEGILVVSGIFAEQNVLLEEAYSQYFKKITASSKDGWTLMVFGRK